MRLRSLHLAGQSTFCGKSCGIGIWGWPETAANVCLLPDDAAAFLPVGTASLLRFI